MILVRITGITADNLPCSYLDVEDEEEPYLSGIKYNAMPPLKRFRDVGYIGALLAPSDCPLRQYSKTCLVT